MTAITIDEQFLPENLVATAKQTHDQGGLELDRLLESSGDGMTGWISYPGSQGIKDFQAAVRYRNELVVHYNLVVVVGIGGSYLGTSAIYEALTHQYLGFDRQLAGDQKRLVFAGNHLSEISAIELIEFLDRCEPLIIVVSKSGRTIEPAVAFRILRRYLQNRYGDTDAKKRIIAITDPVSGGLRNLATQEGFKYFDFPSNVGGRYSLYTASTIVPLTMAGLNPEELLHGAADYFSTLASQGAQRLPCIRYASYRYASFQLGYRVELLAYAQPKLRLLGCWWAQLFGESEGKGEKGLLPYPIGYTTDLHSLGQFVQEGPRVLVETFVKIRNHYSRPNSLLEKTLRVPHLDHDPDGYGFLENLSVEEINTAAMHATLTAHSSGNVPCLELTIPTVDAHTLGTLTAFFMTSCVLSCRLHDVNPFDQPGVEQYKKNLYSLLGHR